MTNKTLLHVISVFLFLILLNVSHSQSFSYYYSNANDTLTVQTFNKLFMNSFVLDPSNCFTENNLLNEYNSNAKSNKFKIEYYKNSLFSGPKTLIQAYFNSKKGGTIKEIFEDVYENSYTENTNKIVFPNKYFNSFQITQDKEASNEGRKRMKKKIYNTFGFDIKSKIKYKIEKILLVNYRNKKVNYLANLTPYLNVNNSTEASQKSNTISYDFHLKNLPEKFDLFLTLSIENSDEKILVVQKNFKYPNYVVESVNPNRNFFKISLIIILIAFALTFICSILIFIFN